MAYVLDVVVCTVSANVETYELLIEGEVVRNKYVNFQWAWNPINPSLDLMEGIYQVVPMDIIVIKKKLNNIYELLIF